MDEVKKELAEFINKILCKEDCPLHVNENDSLDHFFYVLNDLGYEVNINIYCAGFEKGRTRIFHD